MSKPPPELQAHWYAQLEAGGFRDIESPQNPDGPSRDRYQTPLDGDNHAEYYRQAGDYFRRNGRRLAPKARRIVKLHVAGGSVRIIAAQLQCSRRSVETAVAIFQSRMERTRKHTGRRGPRGRGSVIVSARLSDAEAEALHRFVKRLGRTLSHTLRAMIMATVNPSSEQDRMAEIIAEIAAADE